MIARRIDQPRRQTVAAISALVLLVGLPMLPQLAYNVVRFGRWTPLVADNLGVMQQAWGVSDIKYATAMPPIAEAKVHYENPFLPGTLLDETSPLQWYTNYPLRGLLTLALHTFNLLDQDLLFTYSRDLDPWYRIPLGVINHGIVFFGFIGLGLVAGDVRSSRHTATREAFLLLIAAMLCNWAIHVLTAVEMRFGLGLLLVLMPLALHAARVLLKSGRRPVSVGLAATAYVVMALALSDWVRQQAPLIREWRPNTEITK
jgi:hypothetical protein